MATKAQQQPTTQPAPRQAVTGKAPGCVLQRACACGKHAGNGGECEKCRQKRLGTLQRSAVSHHLAGAEAPPIVHDVLRSSGQPLDESIRTFMEPRFGHDFSRVRVHTDAQAAESAQAISARAYTVGSHVAFGSRQYQPNSAAGKALLAHELAHVVQQQHAGSHAGATSDRNDQHEQMARAAAHAVDIASEIPLLAGLLAQYSGPTPMVQRQEAADAVTDMRTEDPDFLVCLILCYLGLPPSLWKTAVEFFLSAIWEEYRATYAQAAAEANFRSYREEFRAYGVVKQIKTVLTFVVHGKVLYVPMRTAAAQALRRRLEKFLVARGATVAGLVVAEQIARKIALAVELAFIAGCSGYCGVVAAARAMTQAATAILEGIDESINLAGSFVRGVMVTVILRPALVAHATVDPTNWDLSPLPSGAAFDIFALGLYLWPRLEPDNPDRFLANVGRPLSTYPIPPVLVRDIARAMGETATSARPSVAVEFTPDFILGLTPFEFVQLLNEWQLLIFQQDPNRVADRALYGEEAQ